MINPHAYRQKAAGIALDRGLYDVASYIMQIDLIRFRHGTPVDVCRMLAGRLKPPKPETEVKKMKNADAERIAAEIRSRDTWDLDLLEHLCDLAGMHDEFAAADGETFESVAYAAAEKLGVEI